MDRLILTDGFYVAGRETTFKFDLDTRQPVASGVAASGELLGKIVGDRVVVPGSCLARVTHKNLGVRRFNDAREQKDGAEGRQDRDRYVHCAIYECCFHESAARTYLFVKTLLSSFYCKGRYCSMEPLWRPILWPVTFQEVLHLSVDSLVVMVPVIVKSTD